MTLYSTGNRRSRKEFRGIFALNQPSATIWGRKYPEHPWKCPETNWATKKRFLANWPPLKTEMKQKLEGEKRTSLPQDRQFTRSLFEILENFVFGL